MTDIQPMYEDRRITITVEIHVKDFYTASARTKALIAAAYLLLGQAGAAEIPAGESTVLLKDEPWMAREVMEGGNR